MSNNLKYKKMIDKMKKTLLFIVLIAGVLFTSCKNGDWDFPDYDYSAVYFAYQTPIRTITLGNDYVNDNSLDNEHKCQIMATVGGFREIKNDIEISFKVDNSLCDGLNNVKAMPLNYYTLSNNNKIIIPKGGKMLGGVVVQLTDAFFADPLSISTNYVIPVLMTGVKNADRILSGQASGESTPNRYIPEDWETVPKDYILYAVKYINPWDATYLRRGKDIITENGVARTVVRRGRYVPEDDELMNLYTVSMSEIEFPVKYVNLDGVDLNMKLKMTFNNNQECVFSAFKTDYNVGTGIHVYDVLVSGSGKYVKDGEKNSWGQRDRDALYLNYNVEYKVASAGFLDQSVKYSTTDTLVFRDRGIKPEFFTPELK